MLYLVPNTDLIFVYGGSATGNSFFIYSTTTVLIRFSSTDSSRAVGDYSYVLNTTSYEWTAINTINNGAGPRFGHSGNF